jgi:hypothetical protein
LTCAQSRVVMVAIWSGICMGQFQAWQHASAMAS